MKKEAEEERVTADVMGLVQQIEVAIFTTSCAGSSSTPRS